MVTRIVDGNNANRLMLLEAEDGGELVVARNSAQGVAITSIAHPSDAEYTALEVKDAGTLYITSSGAAYVGSVQVGGSGGGLTTEQVQDCIAGMLVAGSGITLTYNDAANTLTVTATGGGSSAPLYASGIPVVLIAGDGGANGLSFNGGGGGAFTLSAAILASLQIPAAYWYLPANAGGSGCAAGLYYGTMSSPTAGVIYSNTYDPTTTVAPTIPTSPTAFVGSPAGRITQSLIEVVLAQPPTIAANAMGKNGYIEYSIRTFGSTTGTKSVSLKGNGNVLHSYSIPAAPNVEGQAVVQNAGSYTSQICTRTGQLSGSAGSGYTSDFRSNDFSVANTLTLTAQLSATTDSAVVVPRFIKMTPVA